MTVQPSNKLAKKRSLPKVPGEARIKQSETPVDGDTVNLGASNTEQKIGKPNFENAAKPNPVVMTDHPDGPGLGGFAKGVALALAGTALLTGCTGGTQGTGSSTVDSEAMQQLNESFAGIKESIAEDGDQSQEQIAGKVFSSIADYSRATGEKGEELMGNLAGTIRKHPVLAASIAFAAGNAIGIGADQLGITDQIGTTAADAAQWVKEHPIKSLAIGAAVAGAGYLLYNYAIKPMAEVPPKPTGEHAEAMEKTFKEIEAQLKAEGGDSKKAAQEASLTLTQKLKEYAAATGRSAKEVGSDVHAWAYEHPIVATSLVMAGGVATGTLLSKAGVPEQVAHFAGVAVDAAGDGFQKVGEFAKEHPVVAGAVVAGVAAGAGYLIYTNMGGGATTAPAGG